MQRGHKSIYKTVIKAPAGKVWDALTTPEIVKRYFFGTDMVTNWKVGSPIYFRGEYEGKRYEDKGTVLEYTQGRALSYSYLSSWSGMEDRPENYLSITYRLEQVPDGTALTIEQTNYDAERARHSEQNWKTVIDGLKRIVE